MLTPRPTVNGPEWFRGCFRWECSFCSLLVLSWSRLIVIDTIKLGAALVPFAFIFWKSVQLEELSTFSIFCSNTSYDIYALAVITPLKYQEDYCLLLFWGLCCISPNIWLFTELKIGTLTDQRKSFVLSGFGWRYSGIWSRISKNLKKERY